MRQGWGMVREGLSNNQQDEQKPEEGREQIPWLPGGSELGQGNSQFKGPEAGLF